MRRWHSKLKAREIYALRRNSLRERIRLRCPFFSMYGADGLNRVLIVASKKRIDKRAVLRNRAKRRMRAALDKLDLKEFGLDIMLVLNKEILTADFKELVQETRAKIKRIASRFHPRHRSHQEQKNSV